MSKNRDQYKEVRTFTYPDAIIRVHIPELTKEEREKRMKSIEKAAAHLLRVERKMA